MSDDVEKSDMKPEPEKGEDATDLLWEMEGEEAVKEMARIAERNRVLEKARTPK